MNRVRRRWLAVALVVAALHLVVDAQRPALEKARLELASDRSAYRGGETARIAAMAQVEQGWHIQSHTPSLDYLIPTVLTLDLPDGWAEAKIEYPPHRMWTAQFEPDQPLAVYEGKVRFLATVAIPADWKEDAAEIVATLHYQACDDRQCLPPRDATATLVLPLGEDGEATNEELFVAVAGDGAAAPPSGSGANGSGAAAASVESRPAIAASAPARAAGISFGDLLGKLLLGVLGGLILNAMPCVLPVLSLKLVGILQHAGQDRRAIATGGLATSAGIVASFIALALVAIGVRAAGGLVGWGVQFQNPAFVVFLAIVVVLFCLNLWGVFEVPLPRALSRFDAGGAHHGVLGHFVTGLFATLMATPCSAPFLGTAVGFGLSQSAGVILAVFTAIGVGMALPYLFMAAVPGSVARLPRPGAWMVKLKVVLGFLLAGAAIWLLYVLSSQVSPERLAAIEVGLLVLSMLVWFGGDPMGSRVARVIGRGGALAAIAGTLFLAARATPVAIDVERAPPGGAIGWTAFDRAQAETLARDGRLVFVDVTADWCFTCKANERLILETREVIAAFARLQVVPMRADWTNQNEEIARFLADFGRYSIPFYLLYRPGAEPHLFPELLTKRDVLRVLDESVSREARRE
ncbi:MAG TPA: thioredoxin family protein [Thermoanaerobaculia bacterium]|nr:thioredoxin family protein [Thermoanaerobaculia bacterium]